MKRFKVFLTSGAFLLAIAMTFASSSMFQATVPPNHYDTGIECEDCIIPNGPGNVYNIDYICSPTMLSQVKCTCLLPSGQLRIAAENRPRECPQLFRHNL